MRADLGDGYAEALWAAHKDMPKSADFVMYWWNQAARHVAAAAKKGGSGKPRRFGFITTNSIRQTFNRRVIEKALTGKPPLSIIFAIPDHPWMKSADKATVRIAMTVVVHGGGAGRQLRGGRFGEWAEYGSAGGEAGGTGGSDFGGDTDWRPCQCGHAFEIKCWSRPNGVQTSWPRLRNRPSDSENVRDCDGEETNLPFAI